MLILPIQI